MHNEKTGMAVMGKERNCGEEKNIVNLCLLLGVVSVMDLILHAL